MSLWAADDAKGTLIEPPNQLQIYGILGNCESVFSTFRETYQDLSFTLSFSSGRVDLQPPFLHKCHRTHIQYQPAWNWIYTTLTAIVFSHYAFRYNFV